ncbi:MAG: CvpA family protein [Ruminococcus sp.]|nr:CvpA family protein [Ruminococcus sp.]
MILDIVLIAVVALLIIIGAVRGIARTLYNLLSVFLSGFLAYIASKAAAGWIFDNFIAASIEKSVTESLSSAAQSTGNAAQDAILGLPDYVVGILNTFGVSTDTLAGSVSSAADSSADVVSGAIVGAIAPVFTSVLSVILLVVLFIIFILIFKLLSKKFLKLFELPIIRSANKLLGGALGMCEGIIICYIFILVCRIILPFSQEPFISPEMIDSSIIFRTVYYSDFLNTISALITTGSNTVNEVEGIFGTAPVSTEATTVLN